MLTTLIASMVLFSPGPRTARAGERYTMRQIRLLRLANYLAQFASPDTLAALETVMRGMLKLPGTRRDPRWLRALRSDGTSGFSAGSRATPPARTGDRVPAAGAGRIAKQTVGGAAR